MDNKKKHIYICSEYDMKMIKASSKEEAFQIFENEKGASPKEVLGPFRAKQSLIKQNINIKFSNTTIKAIFNNWLVNAFILKEPKNNAFLTFIKRIDNQDIKRPTGTYIVPISELREYVQ